MRNKAVITGATGYIGSNLLRYLISHNWDLYIIAQPEYGYNNIKDLLDKIHILEYDNNINTLIPFFEEANADVVFHLAAAVITPCKPEQIRTMVQSNIQFGSEVLEAMRFSKTRLFISTGSIWQNYNSDEYNPVDFYAATKEAFEKILQYYTDAFGFRAITLRLFDVYGENDTRPKLLNLIRDILKTGESLNISPGEQELDLVYISDICSAYLKAYEWLIQNEHVKNEIFGVYTGNRIKLKHLIELFSEILGKQANVILGGKPYKEREVMKPFTGLKKLPDWNPEISLMEGLSRFK